MPVMVDCKRLRIWSAEKHSAFAYRLIQIAESLTLLRISTQPYRVTGVHIFMKKGAPPEARAVVLVVDDEPLTRILTVQVLEEAGYQTEEAWNSEEALSRLDGHAIAALVTDVDMPGSMDGCGLAWHVHDHRPTAALIIISGVTEPEADALSPTARFLAKPLDPVRLLRELGEALSQA
jgi:CheY-like chemotaxis protein